MVCVHLGAIGAHQGNVDAREGHTVGGVYVLCDSQGTRHSKDIADQILEVALRVPDVRPHLVSEMVPILDEMASSVGKAKVPPSTAFRVPYRIVPQAVMTVSVRFYWLLLGLSASMRMYWSPPPW